MKDKLAARGVRGIVAVQRRFKIMDDDNSGTINPEEFKKAMRECNIQLSEEVQLDLIFIAVAVVFIAFHSVVERALLLHILLILLVFDCVRLYAISGLSSSIQFL